MSNCDGVDLLGAMLLRPVDLADLTTGSLQMLQEWHEAAAARAQSEAVAFARLTTILLPWLDGADGSFRPALDRLTTVYLLAVLDHPRASSTSWLRHRTREALKTAARHPHLFSP